MSEKKPESLFYICMPEFGDLNKDSIKEITSFSAFKRVKLKPKDFNHDYEEIFGEKVYQNQGKKDDLAVEEDMEENKMQLNCEKEYQVDVEMDPTLKILNRNTLEVSSGVKMTHQIIGFVTTGGYSMLKGYGIAIGAVAKKFTGKLDKGDYVLVRSPASTFYYKAKIERIY
jgi:hypothetical protein